MRGGELEKDELFLSFTCIYICMLLLVRACVRAQFKHQKWITFWCCVISSLFSSAAGNHYYRRLICFIQLSWQLLCVGSCVGFGDFIKATMN
jgi:hypothetical protein